MWVVMARPKNQKEEEEEEEGGDEHEECDGRREERAPQPMISHIAHVPTKNSLKPKPKPISTQFQPNFKPESKVR